MHAGRRSFLIALALPFAGGLATGIATFVGWGILASLVSQISPRQLNNLGLYFDDVGFAYIMALGPIFVGGMFVVTTTIGLLVFLFAGLGRVLVIVVVFLNLLPGAIIFLMLNILPGTNIVAEGMWKYPLTEVVVASIGVVWSIVFMRVLIRTTTSHATG